MVIRPLVGRDPIQPALHAFILSHPKAQHAPHQVAGQAGDQHLRPSSRFTPHVSKTTAFSVLGPIQQEFARLSDAFVAAIGAHLRKQDHIPDRALVFGSFVEILRLAPISPRFLPG